MARRGLGIDTCAGGRKKRWTEEDTATKLAAACPDPPGALGRRWSSELFWLKATTVSAIGCALRLGRGHELGQGRAIPRGDSAEIWKLSLPAAGAGAPEKRRERPGRHRSAQLLADLALDSLQSWVHLFPKGSLFSTNKSAWSWGLSSCVCTQ